MTQAQRDAHVCGLVPEEHDPRFFAQHLAAYAFARQFARGKRVLEVGFGDGYGAHYLAETAREVIAVDLAPGNAPRAAAKYPRANLRFQQMEGTTLAFPDASFDVVGSFQVIEHIPEAQTPAYLAEMKRVLAPGGVCCISTLNLAHNMKPGKPYTKLCYHEKEFTGPELAALLERVFPSIRLYGLYLTPIHRLNQRLKKWGLMRIGPAWANPIARYFEHMSVEGFTVKPRVTQHALDLFAVCRN